MKALSVERSLFEGKQEVKELFEFIKMHAEGFTAKEIEQVVDDTVMAGDILNYRTDMTGVKELNIAFEVKVSALVNADDIIENFAEVFFGWVHYFCLHKDSI